MVGTAVDRQLKETLAPRAHVRFALATRDDDDAIRRLLRENPMRGAVTLTLEREPDYFLGSNIGGGSDQVIVAFDARRLVCMGRCTTRDAWINGATRRVSYLAELRLDASARGRFDILRGGYSFFHQLQRSNQADFSYTSIASDNTRARRFLERGLPGFPCYEHLGNLTTLLISTRSSGFSCQETSAEDKNIWGGKHPAPDLHELAEFLYRTNAGNQLSAVWNPDRIRALAAHGLPMEEFGVIRKRGTIVAAAALWDQRRFRQTVVRDYSPALRLARPFVNTLGAVFGMSTLPPVGSVLAYASLSPIAIAPEESAILPDLVASCCCRAAERNISYLTLALPSNDRRLPGLRRRFHTRTYETRLYRVRWPEEPDVHLNDGPLLPDTALL